ncbi:MULTISPECIES: GNAT family N-acetyltransferase [unclassified Salinicola]|uniref:GNAT family N-acetyltransferase n=1 Tax=unclassified Salinicola TaxID=2634022 RepID=UPI001A8C25CD|nr:MULTISPECIES: GNAT family N-acetyltransferase [unclassified Salinicola]MCE3026562.1 GNAT family N-acetyltransferase [Salinicola sp. DM10]WIX31764.1 GNAT family N-acetyltransferase [Salinicola sp. JS01]
MSQPLPELRRLRPDSPHLDTLARWTYAAWGALYPEESWPQWRDHLRRQCGEQGVPSVFVAIAEEAGREIPVGTASLTESDLDSRPELTPWLASVFVPPAWRGRGIASALVERVAEEARVGGCPGCYLYTPDQQALYARLGWQTQEELDYRGERVTLMWRDCGA